MVNMCDSAAKGDDDGPCGSNGCQAISRSDNQRDHSSSASPLCYRCKERRAVVRTRDKACSDCFSHELERSFRSALRIDCGVSKGTEVIVGLSGGMGSTTLLHLMLKASTASAAGRRTSFSIHSVVYVNQRVLLPSRCAALGVSAREAESELRAFVEGKGLTFAAVDAGSSVGFDGGGGGGEQQPSLAELMDDLSQQDVSAAEEMMEIIRHRDMCWYGSRCGVSKVVLGTCADQMAKRTLTLTCRGGGASLPLVAGATDNRFAPCGPSFVRPLKGLSAKEVCIYHHLCHMPTFSKNPFFFDPPESAAQPPGGLNNLCGSFLQSLQASFPSTVPIVNKTAQKLRLVRHDGDDDYEPDEHVAAQQGQPLGRVGTGVMGLCCGRCLLCFGVRESDRAKDRICRWSHKQQQVLSLLDGGLRDCLCHSCLRLVSTCTAAAKLASLITRRQPLASTTEAASRG
ncbi:unnamed protein product [Vitrella brassicaformis CCMP3155]|uniref:Cytoplasmic tRNA 2-thiolation protein 2 n=1 Tax=Vitrella brassicaformis (strain CCMP3155) TaxID=1169540 RepID=A0A0G4FM28_VITBC|nr:unnamed protein product [Vitrella brassicaformis CCMP3155]|eukprot:CEM14573.1 unnamed protein product [Vitrella brassicaformis CCMP3155]